jgi:hypothetical protein
MKKIAAEEVRNAIFKAFEAVVKGNGIGVREGIAIDDCYEEADRQKARAEDIENHWWEIPEEWKKHALADALSSTDYEGFRFLLPAAMVAAIEGNDSTAWIVFCQLCFPSHENKIRLNPGHKEWIEFLREISPSEIAGRRGITTEQVHAVALYFLWWMQEKKIISLRIGSVC